MQISFGVTPKLISVFVSATQIVQFLFYLNPKFQASSSFQCLYRLVCVGPFQKPHYWFSQEAAQILTPHSSCKYPGRWWICPDMIEKLLAGMLISVRQTNKQTMYNMSCLMGKPTICLGENKNADQVCGNREADQRLCFRYSDSTVPLLLKSEISSF